MSNETLMVNGEKDDIKVNHPGYRRRQWNTVKNEIAGLNVNILNLMLLVLTANLYISNIAVAR